MGKNMVCLDKLNKQIIFLRIRTSFFTNQNTFQAVVYYYCRLKRYYK